MEWENYELFSSKVITTPKRLQSTNWDEEVDGSFNLSDMGNNSSAKSSISASAESSFKDGIKVSNFSFGGFQGSSVSSDELFIGLKLGKRTYFENNFVSSTGKKVKSCSQTSPVLRCQVEGCNLDLSSSKEYHRKHRVCQIHSKCPKVVVNGLEQRFCQQCSRFHNLAEFDEKKRSCRRRLSDHNARRRKPQQETIRFNSTNLSSSFYGGRQQLSFVLNNTPVVQSRPDVSSIWENSSNSSYSIAKMKTDKSGHLDGIPHLLDTQLPDTVNMSTIAFNRSVPSKGTRVEILDQGFKESLSPNVDALDIRRALSLLSNNSWGLYDPDLIPVENLQPIIQHEMHSIPQGLPLLSPDYYQSEQQSSNAASSQFQEFQLFNRFYSNPMDEILKPI